jgi:SOS-response transcriptional repressor LexA
MSKKAKVAGSVVAGFPSPAEQYLEPPLDLNELLVKRPAATYFVRVEGDSMIEAGIHDGDLLVVDRSLRPASGDVIIASVDGDFTVKTLRLGNRDEERGNRKKGIGNREQGIGNREQGIGKRDEETDIRREPANPKYPTIVLEPGQKLDYFGKVTACIHRF